jgi:hypothetical protein
MEPAKTEPERPAKKLSRKERLHAEDLELLGRVGQEFGLGPVECVSRYDVIPSGLSVLGCLMIMAAILGGVPTGIIVGLSSDTPTTKLIVVAIIIGVFFLGWPLGAVSALSDEVDNRVALYPDGVAQLRRDEPEPIVLRWADVETVMIELTTDEGTPLTDLASCTLGGRSGIQVVEKKNARAVAAAAHRALGPRLVPPLLAACDRGEPVSAGDARIDPDGFTLLKGQRLAWSEIKSVTMQHARKGPQDVPTRIDVHAVRRNRLHYFDPTGVPNAIFFAHVLARAATRNGVQVDGYQGTWQ